VSTPRELVPTDAADVLRSLAARDGLPVTLMIPAGGEVVAAVIIIKTITSGGEVAVDAGESDGCGWFDRSAMIREASAAVERGCLITAMRNVRDETRPA
jgi:hypothetical protein